MVNILLHIVGYLGIPLYTSYFMESVRHPDRLILNIYGIKFVSPCCRGSWYTLVPHRLSKSELQSWPSLTGLLIAVAMPYILNTCISSETYNKVPHSYNTVLASRHVIIRVHHLVSPSIVTQPCCTYQSWSLGSLDYSKGRIGANFDPQRRRTGSTTTTLFL